MDELFDLIEHPVDRLREQVELVRSALCRQTSGEIPFDDGASRLPDAMHLGEKRTPDQQSADEACDE